MPAVTLIDQAAERVGALVCTALREVLGDRLVCLAAHGSAVTGYLPGVSDFDFVVFMHGRLDQQIAQELQARCGEADIAPFTVLQISRVLDVDAPEHNTGLIDGAYAMLYGAIPGDWTFLSDDELRESGRAVLRAIQQGWRYRLENWAIESGIWRKRRIRLWMTEVKPATRAYLVELGEPVRDVWRADYSKLARALRPHDAALADRLDRILRLCPALLPQEAELGSELLSYIGEIGWRARALGIA
jgi:hypothetical protein